MSECWINANYTSVCIPEFNISNLAFSNKVICLGFLFDFLKCSMFLHVMCLKEEVVVLIFFSLNCIYLVGNVTHALLCLLISLNKTLEGIPEIG